MFDDVILRQGGARSKREGGARAKPGNRLVYNKIIHHKTIAEVMTYVNTGSLRNVDIWKEADMYPMAEFLREKRLRWTCAKAR